MPWLVLLLAALGGIQGDPAPESPTAMQRFQQGIEAYRRGDPESAATLWGRLLDERPEELSAAVLCYDLGNAAFRRERPLEAAGWYAASLRLEPRRADAWANLELAREKAGLDPADRGDLVDTLRRLATAWTLGELEWTLLALAGVLLVILLVEAALGGVVLRRTAWGLVAAIVVLGGLWTWRLAGERGRQLFVTETGGATVRSEPRADAAAVGRAEPAELMLPLDALPGWHRVRTPAGLTGWVRAGDVLELPAPRSSP